MTVVTKKGEALNVSLDKQSSVSVKLPNGDIVTVKSNGVVILNEAFGSKGSRTESYMIKGGSTFTNPVTVPLEVKLKDLKEYEREFGRIFSSKWLNEDCPEFKDFTLQDLLSKAEDVFDFYDGDKDIFDYMGKGNGGFGKTKILRIICLLQANGMHYPINLSKDTLTKTLSKVEVAGIQSQQFYGVSFAAVLEHYHSE
jgi:hypothetical protein